MVPIVIARHSTAPRFLQGSSWRRWPQRGQYLPGGLGIPGSGVTVRPRLSGRDSRPGFRSLQGPSRTRGQTTARRGGSKRHPIPCGLYGVRMETAALICGGRPVFPSAAVAIDDRGERPAYLKSPLPGPAGAALRAYPWRGVIVGVALVHVVRLFPLPVWALASCWHLASLAAPGGPPGDKLPRGCALRTI